MQRLVCLALCLAVANVNGFTPNAAPTCQEIRTNGGDMRFPHEKYCQVFYSCDQFNNRFETVCPKPSLFAYGDGVTTCSVLGSTKYTCPNWQCTASDVGQRYPDVCCDKYWECTSAGKYNVRECAAGTNFNSLNGICQSNAITTNVCTDHKLCYPDPISNWVPNQDFVCSNSIVPNDACSYMTDGWAETRKCPLGTAYDQTTCACTTFSIACSSSGLTQAQFNTQKRPDDNCRASGRIDFSSIPLITNSYKLSPVNQNTPVSVDHYYSYKQDTTTFVTFNTDTQGNRVANFNGLGALYDFYYVDNILFSPFAISLTVKFSGNSFAAFGTSNPIKILENVYYEGSNKYCQEATIGIYATFTGTQNGQNQWRFKLSVKGEGATINQQVITEANIAGITNDYFRVVFWVNSQLTGSVQNMGSDGRNAGGNSNRVIFPVTSGSIGARIGTNKCGFSIGQNLVGSISEFAVYEGCNNAASTNLLTTSNIG